VKCSWLGFAIRDGSPNGCGHSEHTRGKFLKLPTFKLQSMEEL